MSTKTFFPGYTFEICICSDFCLGIAAGFAMSASTTEQLRYVPYTIFEILGMITTVLSLRSSRIIWGFADVTYQKWVLLSLSMWVVLLISWFLVHYAATFDWGPFIVSKSTSLVYHLTPVLGFGLLALSGLVGIRGAPWLAGICTVVGIISVIIYDLCGNLHKLSSSRRVPIFVVICKTAVTMLASTRTRYLHHQRLAVCVGVQPIVAYFAGSFMAYLVWPEPDDQLWPVVGFLFAACFGVLVVYTNIMLRRSRRHLPPDLAKAKFVRLGYLRHLLRSGKKFCRCQDLPEEAFGDPLLAAHIIIVSHRWFDPYTCDMGSCLCPQGVKLTSLIARLEEHFTQAGPSIYKFVVNFNFGRLHEALCVGGWDVVLFIDFLSVPQGGLHEDGSTIPRTAEEQLIFDTCLPAMGTLYSTFPVLVLDEEPEESDGRHTYFDSGWCTCELTVAMLGRNLDKYSSLQLSVAKTSSEIRLSQNNMDPLAAAAFANQARREIRSKHFLHESDRKVALGIIDGFHSRRVLADAVVRQDLPALQRELKSLKSRGLLATLDEPVDDRLNTVLHLAVRVGCSIAVQQLLEFGAKQCLRNIRGDTPDQIFMFPRCSGAAYVCRSGGRHSNHKYGEALLEQRNLQVSGQAEGISPLTSDQMLKHISSSEGASIADASSRTSDKELMLASSCSSASSERSELSEWSSWSEVIRRASGGASSDACAY